MSSLIRRDMPTPATTVSHASSGRGGAVHRTVNYSSRMEGFAASHWNAADEKLVREEDVEAGVEAPLLGSDPHASGRPKSLLGLPMISPNSWLAETCSVLTLLTDCTYTAFAVAISIAWRSDLGRLSWMTIWDLIAGAIFTANVLLNLHTGIVVRYNLQRRLIMDGRAVAKFYLLQGGAVPDVLSTIPAWFQALSLVGLLGMPSTQLFRALLALRWLRLLRLALFVRAQFVASLLGHLGRRLLSWRVPLTTLFLIDLLYCGMVLTNVLGCVWMFVAQCEGLSNSWLADVGGQDLSQARPVDQYFAAVLFAMATMSTVGYGDTHAGTTPERAVTLVIMLIGVVFFGFVISTMGRLLEMSSTEARRAVLFRDKINKVDAWTSYRRLPGKLRSEIVDYYAESWVPQSEIHEAALFEELPAFLKGQVAGHLLREILEATGLWDALPEGEGWRLSAIFHPQNLLTGHDLCQEGEPATCLWLLQEGELLAIKHAVQWESIAAPALIGEEALLADEQPEFALRTATFRAVCGCTLWRLSLEELQPLLRVFPDLRRCLHSMLRQRSGSEDRGGMRRSMDLGGGTFDRRRERRNSELPSS